MLNWESTEKLRCGRCANYLSVFPIHSALNEISICGRCRPNDSLEDPIVCVRNIAYETLAEFLLFPCIYDREGCLEKLQPQDVAEHEKICPFRTLHCMQVQCKWHGPCTSLHDHYIDLHPNFILRSQEFEMDFLGSYNLYHLIEYEQEMFMLKRSFEESTEILSCSVVCYFTTDYTRRYDYKVIVSNGARDLSTSFAEKPTDSLHEDNSTKIHCPTIMRNLKDPTILIGKIVIIEKQTTIQKKNDESEIDMNLLRELECPVCFNYITPPIFQCVTGHSICAECKNKVSECPTCKNAINNTQNFTLERVAVYLTFPCRFEGCDYTAKAVQMKEHQKLCIYGPLECILQEYEDCRWKGSGLNTLTHIQTNHHDNLLDVDIVEVAMTEDYFDIIDEQCFVMKFANQLFKLHYRYANEIFNWAMQLVGPPEDAGQYQYEIDIVDSSERQQRFCVRSVCAPLTKKDDSFRINEHYVYISLDQIKSLVQDDFAYRVRLLK